MYMSKLRSEFSSKKNFKKLSLTLRFKYFFSHIARCFSRLSIKSLLNYSLEKNLTSSCKFCLNNTKQYYISQIFFGLHLKVYKKDNLNKKYYFCYCKNCHFAYFSPNPSQDYLDFFYKNEVYRGRGLSDKAELKILNSNIMTSDMRYIYSLIDDAGIKLNNKMSILEIGSGRSAFVNYGTQKMKLNFTLNDLSKISSDFMKRNFNVKVIQCDVLDIPLNYDRSFDFIFSKDTLEHLPDPRKVLFKISNLLKKNGTCVFSIPNLDSATLNLILEPHIAFAFPDHLNYFSTKSFLKNCAVFNLKVIFVTTHSFLEESVYANDFVSDLGLLRAKYDLKSIINMHQGERIFIAVRKIN